MNKEDFLLKANSHKRYVSAEDFINQVKSGNIGLHINQSIAIKQEGYDAIVTIQCEKIYKTIINCTEEISNEILKEVKYWLLTSGYFTNDSLTIKVKYAER